jgi:hypothetical protein
MWVKSRREGSVEKAGPAGGGGASLALTSLWSTFTADVVFSDLLPILNLFLQGNSTFLKIEKETMAAKDPKLLTKR